MSAFRSQVKILDELSRKLGSRSLPTRKLQMKKFCLFIPGKTTLIHHHHHHHLFLETQNYSTRKLFPFFKRKNSQDEKKEKTPTPSRLTMFANRFTQEKFFRYIKNAVPFKQITKNMYVKSHSTSRICKTSTDISEPKPETSSNLCQQPQDIQENCLTIKSGKPILTELSKKCQQDLEKIVEKEITMQQYKMPNSELKPRNVKVQGKKYINMPDTENSVPQNYSLKSKNSLELKTSKRPAPSDKNTIKYGIRYDSKISEGSQEKNKVLNELGLKYMQSAKKFQFFGKGNKKSKYVSLHHDREQHRRTTITKWHKIHDSSKLSKMKRTKKTEWSIQKLKHKKKLETRKVNTFSTPGLIAFQKLNANKPQKTFRINISPKMFQGGGQAKIPRVHTVGEMETGNGVVEVGGKTKWIHRSDIFNREIIQDKYDTNKGQFSNSSIMSTLQKNNTVPQEKTYYIVPPRLSPDFIIKTQLTRKNYKIAPQDILAKYNLDKIPTTVPSYSSKPQLGNKKLKVPGIDVKSTLFPSMDKSKTQNILGLGKLEQVLNPGYENHISIQKNLPLSLNNNKNQTVTSPNLTSDIETKSKYEDKGCDNMIIEEKEKLSNENNKNLMVEPDIQANSKKLDTISTKLTPSSLVPIEFYTNIRKGVRVASSLGNMSTQKLQNDAQIFNLPTQIFKTFVSKMNFDTFMHGLYEGVLTTKAAYLHLSESMYLQPELTSSNKQSLQWSLSSKNKNKQQPDIFQSQLMFKHILLKMLGGPILPEKHSEKPEEQGTTKNLLVNKNETNNNKITNEAKKVNLVLSENTPFSQKIGQKLMLSNTGLLLFLNSKRYCSSSKPTLYNWGMQDPTLEGRNSIECKSSGQCKKKEKCKKQCKKPKVKEECESKVQTCKRIRLPGCRKSAFKCREVLEHAPCVRKEPPQPSFSECLKFPLFVKKFSECDCHQKKIKKCESEPKEPKHYDGCRPPKPKPCPPPEPPPEECK